MVIKVGPHVVDIKEGDTAIWGDYSGQMFEEKDDGTVLRILEERDIVAVEVT